MVLSAAGPARPIVVKQDDGIPPENLRDFDERAFLAGQLSLVNDPDSSTTLPPRMPKKKGNIYNVHDSSTTLPPRMPKKKGNYYNIHDSSTTLPPRISKKKGNIYDVPDCSNNLTPRIP